MALAVHRIVFALMVGPVKPRTQSITLCVWLVTAFVNHGSKTSAS